MATRTITAQGAEIGREFVAIGHGDARRELPEPLVLVQAYRAFGNTSLIGLKFSNGSVAYVAPMTPVEVTW